MEGSKFHKDVRKSSAFLRLLRRVVDSTGLSVLFVVAEPGKKGEARVDALACGSSGLLTGVLVNGLKDIGRKHPAMLTEAVRDLNHYLAQQLGPAWILGMLGVEEPGEGEEPVQTECDGNCGECPARPDGFPTSKPEGSQ
jgi:hypothetical protein